MVEHRCDVARGFDDPRRSIRHRTGWQSRCNAGGGWVGTRCRRALCQGDGEVCGTAVEYPSTTTIRVDVIKGWSIDWPRLEREDFIMAIGSARPLEDATRIAYRELVLWMETEYGFDRWDAYMMLSQCGRVRLGNFVDPKYTVSAGILKSWLAP
jgi:amidase